MSAHRGEVTCSVTTAKALDDKTMKELRTTLEGFLKKGQTLQLEAKVLLHSCYSHNEFRQPSVYSCLMSPENIVQIYCLMLLISPLFLIDCTPMLTILIE